MIDTTTPHVMRRASPGDKRCADCGLTAGTKAHRAGRDAARAQQAPAEQAPAEVHVDQVAEINRESNVLTSTTTDDLPVEGVPAMRATVTRTDLVAALTYAVKSTHSRPERPALAGVRLTVAGDTLAVSGYDWQTFRAADVLAAFAEDGEVAIDGKTLLSVIKSLPKEARMVHLSVSADGASLAVSDGSQTQDIPTDVAANVATMPAEDLPAAPPTPEVMGTVDAAELARLARVVVPAAGTDAQHPAQCAVRVRTDGSVIDMAATDRYRAHLAAGTWAPAQDEAGFLVAPGSEYAVSAKVFGEVAALFAKRARRAPATVTVRAGLAGYGLECGGYRAIFAETTRDFPPVENVFPETVSGTVTVEAKALTDAVTTITGGAKGGAGAIPVVVQFHDGQITVQYGAAGDEECPLRSATLPATFDGDVPAYVGLNARFVVEAIAATAGPAADAPVVLGLRTAFNPVTVTSDQTPDVRVLLMPVRVSLAAPEILAMAGRKAAESAAQPAVEPAQEDVPATPGTSGSEPVKAPVVDAATLALVEARRAAVASAVVGPQSYVLDSRGGVTSVNRAHRHNGIAGWLIDNGGYPHFAATVEAAIVGANVCEQPYPHGCGMAHTDAATLAKLPTFTPADTAPADTAPVSRGLVDGRDVVTLDEIVPDIMPAPILPAGALDKVPAVVGPKDFRPFLPQINMCACAVCTELGYNSHHYSDKRRRMRCARVLFAHLVAGTHERVEYSESGQFAKRALDARVQRLRDSGATDEEIDKVEHADVYMRIAAREAVREDMRNGMGLGIGNAPIRAERAERLAKEAAGDGPAADAARLRLARQTRLAELAEARASGGTLTAVDVDGKRGTVLIENVQLPDETVSDVMGAPYRMVSRGQSLGRGVCFRYLPVKVEPATEPATEPVQEDVPAVAETSGSEPVEAPSVTLVYRDEAPAVAPAAAPAGDVIQGAHPERIHVTDAGTFDGYRFHLVAGSPARQLGKTVRRALAAKAGQWGAFYVTAPAGSRTVNVAAREASTSVDWVAVLALVAGFLGESVATDGAGCELADCSRRLVRN